MNKKLGSNSADSLEQKLITTRYSVVDQLITVRDSFTKEQLQLNQQKQKINLLRQKLLQLQNADTLNHKIAAHYQDRTYKLQTTQAMAVALYTFRRPPFHKTQQFPSLVEKLLVIFRRNRRLTENWLQQILIKIFQRRRDRDHTSSSFQGASIVYGDCRTCIVALMAVKVDLAKTKEEVMEEKRNSCTEMRTSISQSRNKALSIFEKRKSARIQRMRNEERQHQLLKKRLNDSDMEYRRNKSNEIRQSQINARQRLKRYEQFRLAQARFNYDQKKSELLRTHAEKLNLLKQLQVKMGSADEVFEKTKLLNQEVVQIQSLYITGQ